MNWRKRASITVNTLQNCLQNWFLRADVESFLWRIKNLQRIEYKLECLQIGLLSNYYRKDKWLRPSDTPHRCSQGLPILLVKSELRTEPTLTPNTPNLDPTLTPNKPICSDDHFGGSNIIYLTHL